MTYSQSPTSGRAFTVATLAIGLILITLSLVLGVLDKHQAKADFLNPDSNHLLPPTNISMESEHLNQATHTTISWTAVPRAVSYSVYLYDVKLASGITATSYPIDPATRGKTIGTYYVTATDADGVESIPSAISNFLSAWDPSKPAPSWDPDAIPSELSASGYQNLLAVPEWNLGAPRIDISWTGSSGYGVAVFKDGTRLPGNFLGNRYIDSDVAPGSTHTYSLAKVKAEYLDKLVGPQTATVSATALTAQPAFLPTPIQITRIVPNDDSAKIFFKAVPGAVDYRVYSLSNLNTTKYAGSYQTGIGGDQIKNRIHPLSPPQELDIEMNGLPTSGADLVIEAVDKLGPFQKADGFAGPGAAMGTSINGQGDPSDIPNVIACSQAVHVTLSPFSLKGSQSFLDTFRNEQPLQQVSFANIDPNIIKTQCSCATLRPNQYSGLKQEKNDKWTITQYGTDTTMTRNFFMGNHFMDTEYDGPSYDTAPFSHNNNASDVLQPNQTADISGGKVLHVTMEVDAHFDGRRWVDIMIGGVGDTLLRPVPGKLDGNFPTTSGNLFFWEIDAGNYQLKMIHPDPADPTKTTQTDLFQSTAADSYFVTARDIYTQIFSHGTKNYYPNGSPLNLDNRSTFDLYLSKTHYKVVETLPDGIHQLVHERDFPAGISLPWDQLQVYYTHQVYHTGNDINELRGYDWDAAYWYENRPWADERHWDNMGFEVIDSVPATTPTLASVDINGNVISNPGSPTPTPAVATPTPKATGTPTPTPSPYSTPVPTPTTTPSVTPSPSPTIPDDFNHDGKLNLTDLIAAIEAFNSPTPDGRTQAVFDHYGHQPSLSDLISLIYQYQQLNR